MTATLPLQCLWHDSATLISTLLHCPQARTVRRPDAIGRIYQKYDINVLIPLVSSQTTKSRELANLASCAPAPP